MYPRRKPLAALLPLIFSLPLHAEQALDPIVVTATRQPQRVTELLSDVTVLDREEIERAGNSNLAELLSRQPGLEISMSGGAGQNANIFIRGANGNQTLVLVDGMRINSATLGQASLSRLPLSQIERVEILRGPGSALYGADAIGGVIQVFTRRGEGAPRYNLFIGAGTQDSYEASAGISGALDRVSFSAQAGASSTAGFSAVANPESSFYWHDRDGYRNRNFSGNLAWRFLPDHELGASLFHSDGQNRSDSRYVWPRVSPASYDYRQDLKVEGASVYLRDRFLPGWTSTLRLGQTVDDGTSHTAFSQDRYRTRQDQLSWQNDIRLPIGRALFAVEELQQAIRSNNAFDRNSRSIFSVLAGWSGNLGAHRFQLNVRNDDNTQFGNRTTAFAAYGYQFTDVLRGHLSYGTAFKAPTFNDLYYGGPGGTPNPNLRPESSENWEAALAYEGAGRRASATYYHNRVKNLIDWAANPLPLDPFNWSPMNINKALLEGVTLAAGGTLANWDIAVSADFQSPRDEATGHRLQRRATRHGSLAATYLGAGWRLGGEIKAVGQRYDNLANTRSLPGYTLVNLIGAYSLGKDWSLEGRLNNIFDEKAQQSYTDNFDGTFSQFLLPGFNAFVGLRYAPR
jgi:vitamin B12 transporter